jgi:hypothetical protein
VVREIQQYRPPKGAEIREFEAALVSRAAAKYANLAFSLEPS